jgi:hypothetical protein
VKRGRGGEEGKKARPLVDIVGEGLEGLEVLEGLEGRPCRWLGVLEYPDEKSVEEEFKDFSGVSILEEADY